LKDAPEMGRNLQDHLQARLVHKCVRPTMNADSPAEGPHKFSAFTSSVCQLRPESRGHLELSSPNPADYPLIHPNYLATPLDQQTMVEGVKIARQIAEAEPLKSSISSEHAPGVDVQSDDELLEWVRNTSTTIYHPTGTCRMGQDDGAIVDERLRVKGFSNLRVADCSIMPTLVSGNTNAPAIMIGEKLSDMIREDAQQLAGAA